MLKQLLNTINKKSVKAFTLILLIILLSALPRIWNLLQTPPVIVDEPANIRDINLVLKNGVSLTQFHWDYSKSQIVHIPVILLIKLGVSNELLALRLTSVIISLASLIPFFLIAEYISNLTIAFSSTLLFSYSYYFLEFSRVGWTDVISGIFLSLLLFWLITIITKRKHPDIKLFIFAGIIAGAIFYGYRSGIIIILAAILTIFPKKLIPTKKFWIALGRFTVFLSFFALTSLPWLRTIYQKNESYNLRLRVVSVNNVNLPYHNLLKKQDILRYQIKQTLDSWVFLKPVTLSGNEDPRYLPQGFQIVNWFVKIGFWIGIILGILKIKKIYPLFLIFLMGLYGQIITVNPPNGARGLIMLPCIYLFFTIFLDKVNKMNKKNKYIPAIIIFLSIIYSVADFVFYQYWMGWIKV